MLQAKKKFSQNFLVDNNLRDKALVIMQRIVSLKPELELIEIGPGAGDLTKEIIEWKNTYSKYSALEIDPEAVEFLENLGLKNEHYPNFNLIFCDAWKSLVSQKNNNKTTQHELSLRAKCGNPLLVYNQTKTLQSYSYPQQFNLISSLPYAIGSRIMVDLAVTFPKTNFAVILQKEVAIKCIPNPKNFNFFGAWLNLFWSTKVELILPPHAFNPQPKVHSAVLAGIFYDNQIIHEHLTTQESRNQVKNILKTLFSQPSKTLYNNLKKLDWTKEQLERFYNENKLDTNLRLDWSNYEQILKLILTF